MIKITPPYARQLAAEFAGTLFLLATVIGSGIMAERLAGGNIAVALLGNTIPTGAILYVLITIFGPVSGAHFNPAVTLAFFIRRQIPVKLALLFVVMQIIGGMCGAFLAHFMFEMPILQMSTNLRTGPAQWGAEFVATFGLLLAVGSLAVAWLGLALLLLLWSVVSRAAGLSVVFIITAVNDKGMNIASTDVSVDACRIVTFGGEIPGTGGCSLFSLSLLLCLCPPT